MDFQTKTQLIEEARKKYLTFDNAFREYTATGNSINGAYNFFTLQDIEKYESEYQSYLEIEAWKTLHGSSKDSSPIQLESHSIIEKLETLNEQLDNPTRNKRLPKSKNS